MSDNKYSVDMERLIKNEDEQRRELRRKKHKRDRIVSWIFFLVFVLILTLGTIGVVRVVSANMGVEPGDIVVSSTVSTSNSVSVEPEDIDDTISEILGGETSISVSIPDFSEPEPTEKELFDAAVAEFVAAMPLEDKVAGIFVVSLEQLTGVSKVTKAGDTTKKYLEMYPVGGVVITSKNLTKLEKLSEMTANIKSYSKYPLFLGVDEEPGNTVLASKFKLESTKTAAKIGDTMDPGVAYDESEKIAKYLLEYGFNFNLGIVADVLPTDTTVLGNRAYGQDPVIVGQLVSETVTAYEDAGIVTGIKFFPGEGGANKSTSEGVSTTERTKEEFLASEMEVYKKALVAGGDILIVSHEYAPNITGDNNQCSSSKNLLSEVIRNEQNLKDVIIMTDAMDKAAITEYFEAGEAAVASIKAGADMILFPADFKEAYDAVLSAVNKGVIAKERIDDSLKRIYSVKFAGMSASDIEALIPAEAAEAEKVEE